MLRYLVVMYLCAIDIDFASFYDFFAPRNEVVREYTGSDPPLSTGKLLIKFQNILRNTTQVIIRLRVKILFSVKSSPITLARQKHLKRQIYMM
jgi:hypothetical protein